MKQIALIKTGCTIDQIKPRHGDFEDWFAEGMGVTNLLQVDVFREQALPAVENLAGVVVTGSPAMVSSRLGWSERTARWLQEVVTRHLPVLGVCYGHQLLAHALGGVVGPNPEGRQIGTKIAHLVDIKQKDLLLGHLPNQFTVQASHSEVVLELPPGAQCLGYPVSPGVFRTGNIGLHTLQVRCLAGRGTEPRATIGPGHRYHRGENHIEAIYRVGPTVKVTPTKAGMNFIQALFKYGQRDLLPDT